MAMFPFPVLGKLFYVALLLINAMAVLSEDRFLARIGWVNSQQRQQQQQAMNAYQMYDQPGGAIQSDVGMKAKLIDLISAVRTLMRIPLIGFNVLVIIYELVLGG